MAYGYTPFFQGPIHLWSLSGVIPPYPGWVSPAISNFNTLNFPLLLISGVWPCISSLTLDWLLLGAVNPVS